MKVLTVLLPLMVWVTWAHAQDKKQFLKEMTVQDKEVIEALVIYPEAVRNTIFQACQYPEVLVRLEMIQNKSQTFFQEMIKGFSQNKQKGFYELSRYPELMEALVVNGPLSKDAVRELASGYPKDIQKVALQYGRKNYEVLKAIHDQRQQVEAAYIELMSAKDVEVQRIFKSLVAEPDILSILTDNIKMAVLVGDLYKNEPDWLSNYADSLHLVEARANAQELEEWRQKLSSDPQAMAEMELAAKEFARENAFELSEAPSPEVEVIYRPYPYWFGYPYWYDSPWWYPYPYWYHTGYYLDASGTIIIVGLPSFYYSVWFYNSPRYYSRLRHHYWWFYDHYPYSRSGLVVGFRTAEKYNPRIRTAPRTSREGAPQYRTPPTRTREDRTIRQRTTARPPAPGATRSTVQRERANDYHREHWSKSRQPRERSKSQTQPTSRKTRTKN